MMWYMSYKMGQVNTEFVALSLYWGRIGSGMGQGSQKRLPRVGDKS